MSITDRAGQLGGQDIYLRNDRPAPYVRALVPVTPQRTDIEGDSEGVSPDPLLRHWTQEDFSGGAGFPMWESNKIGFDKSDGILWDSLTRRLQPRPQLAVDNAFTDGGPFTTREGLVVTSANAGTDHVTIGLSDTSPTWASDGFAVKAASTPTTISFITDTTTAKAVTTYSNGDLYLNAALWKAFGGLSLVAAVFDDLCYVPTVNGLDVMDSFATPATSTPVAVTPYNFLKAAAGQYSYAVPSDVGIVWLVKDATDRVSLWEYNVAGVTQEVLAVMPSPHCESVIFAFDGYWVPYTQYSGTGRSSLWLWYLVNGVQGRVGPFPDNKSTTVDATPPVVLGTTDQNKIIIMWNNQVFAYDVEDTSMVALLNLTYDLTLVSGSTGVVYGFAYGDLICLTHDNGKVAVYPTGSTRSDTGSTGLIWLGAWDGGYPGVQKTLTSVTISTEPLQAGTNVILAYRMDNAASYTALPLKHDVVGATTYTWYPSIAYPGVSGDSIQLLLGMVSTTLNGGPFVRKVSASMMPDEAFAEWDLEIDLGDDRSGRLDSKVTADWLWGLANETTFVDTWSVRDTDAGTTHNVRILERALGPVGRDGPQYARVKLRKVERV